MKKQTENSDQSNIIDDVGVCYTITPHLRYAQFRIHIYQGCKYELRIQQMWQSSDGKQKWEWIEVFE